MGEDMKRLCAWCGEEMGEKPGEGETHGICEKCAKKLLNYDLAKMTDAVEAEYRAMVAEREGE
jgi:hypothetical protein